MKDNRTRACARVLNLVLFLAAWVRNQFDLLLLNVVIAGLLEFSKINLLFVYSGNYSQ